VIGSQWAYFIAEFAVCRIAYITFSRDFQWRNLNPSVATLQASSYNATS